MSDIAAIKDRIRKLMAYANDGQASEGEIENAMGHAARLIDKHHLDKSEFTQKEKQDEERIGQATGKTQSSKFHQWESTLAAAVADLFGCLKHYLSDEPIPLRVNGVVQFYKGKYAGQMKMARQVIFYGPAVEAQEASELYTEWVHLIASMGVMRWGGAYRGDGEAYCQGFSTALWEQAQKIQTSRQLVEAKPLALLAGETQTTAITLTRRYDILKERASEWMEKEQGVKLSSGSGRTGAASGSSGAYAEGKAHGSVASFTRKTQRKQLPGG